MADEVRYIEMFGGIGGFRKGIEQATSRARCVGYYEIDKYAVQTYNKNFGEEWQPTDITKLSAEEVPKHDILTAGFPCQSFSIAGKRQGFQDTRGTMFFEICRIVETKRPPLLFLENVKGLLSHDEGQTFRIILKTLDELGYDAEWQVLNSKHYGVPQNRERVFIIGHLRMAGSRQIFPIGESGQVPVGEQGEIKMIQNSGKEIARVYDTDGLSPTLKGKTGGWQEPKISACIDANYWKGNSPSYVKNNRIRQLVCPVLTPDREEKRQHGRRFKDNGEPMFTLTGQDIHRVMVHNTQPRSPDRPSLQKNPNAGGSGHISKMDETYCLDSANAQAGQLGQSIRRLTPVECERLQGFPDGWTDAVSDTQRYKQLGNAVTVNVIQAIAERLLKCSGGANE